MMSRMPYSEISVTTPAPPLRPPSQNAYPTSLTHPDATRPPTPTTP